MKVKKNEFEIYLIFFYLLHGVLGFLISKRGLGVLDFFVLWDFGVLGFFIFGSEVLEFWGFGVLGFRIY